MSGLAKQPDPGAPKTKLHAAVLSDVLDQLGHPNQAVKFPDHLRLFDFSIRPDLPGG